MMNVQVRKELGGLRWAWLVAMVVAWVPLVRLPRLDGRYFDSDVMGTWGWLFFLGCVAVGVEVIGHEFTGRSFGLLLTQPVSRRALWRRKMAALGLVLGTVLAVFLGVSLWVVMGGGVGWVSPGVWVMVCLLLLVAGVGPALWLSLVVRQPAAVFWLALLLPTSLYGVVGMVAEWLGGRGVWRTPGLMAVGLVGGLAWWAAYRMFLRAEDSAMLGREMHLPRVLRWKGGSTGPAGALWRKELRLHQLPGLVTLLGAVLMLGMLMVHWVAPTESSGLFLMVVLCLWLLVPVFVGAGAVAEERRLGTVAAWRMLPVSATRQWRTKVGAAMVVALGLGAVVPWALNGVAWWALHGSVREVPVVAWWFWGAWGLVGATLGLYGSSVSRNLVQALTMAVVVLGGAVGVVAMLVWWHQGDFRVMRLGAILGGVLLVPVLWRLAASNARQVVIERRTIWCNATVIPGVWVVIALLTGGLFNRAWERLLPEPAPGVALPVLEGVQPHVQVVPNADVGRVAVLTPDGRLWLWYGIPWAERVVKRAAERRELGAGRVYRSIGVCGWHLHAVDTQGNMWDWELRGSGGGIPASDPPARRVGLEGEWQAVSGNSEHAVALKRDGSLWGFGRSWYGQLGRRSQEYREEWVRLGADRTWRLASASHASTLAMDVEGRVWRWGSLPGAGAQQRERMDWSEPHQLAASNAWVRLHGRLGFNLGAGELADGSVWAFDAGVEADGRWAARPPTRLRTPVAGLIWDRRGMVGLATDGRLWEWSSPDVYDGQLWEWLNRRAPRGLSGRSDWVAVSPQGLGLTGDGMVWMRLEDGHTGWLRPLRRMQPVLAPSGDGGG
jgi:hypothetical protein